ncbi:MAG: alcohol dehydrogenase catalytic domain-containing protein [Myxococcota bacterium]
MKAVRKSGDGIAVVEVPPPEGAGVRVRVRSSGICGSDLHLLRSDFPMAHTLGHEIAGHTPDGTAVAVEPVTPCGTCPTCRAGDYNLCELGSEMVIGLATDGGMAEEVLVPERCLVPLPAGVSPTEACLVEPLAVAIHGLRRARLRGDQRAVVIGAGSIGLCAVAGVAAAGAEVAVVARHDAQREAAARLGAREIEGSYDLVIDASGTRSGLARCLELCRPGGTLLLVGSYWDGFELSGMELCLKEITVVPASMYGRDGAARDIDVAASTLALHPGIADAIITHRYPLEAAEEAFRTAADRSAGSIKVVLEP